MFVRGASGVPLLGEFAALCITAEKGNPLGVREMR
jgi:hypothetical protein